MGELPRRDSDAQSIINNLVNDEAAEVVEADPPRQTVSVVAHNARQARRIAKWTQGAIQPAEPRGIWAWKTGSTPQTPQQKAAPLHAKPVTPMSRRLLETIAETHSYLRFLWDPELFRAFDLTGIKAHITLQEMNTLCAKGLYETSTAQPSGVLFTTFEYAKYRRRVVHDALVANVSVNNPPVKFQSLQVLRNAVNKGTIAAVLDFSAFYWQFELDASTRPFFAVRIDNYNFQPTRLPMGFGPAAAIAQVVSEYVANTVRQHLTFLDVYIDGLLLVTDSLSRIETALNHLRKVFTEWGLQLSDDKGPATQVVFRGIQLDFSRKEIQLAPSFVEKFSSQIPQNEDTWASWRSCIARLIYAFMATGLALAHISTLLRFGARHVFTRPTHKVVMWKSAVTMCQQAVTTVLVNRPIKINQHEYPVGYVVITDAATNPVPRGGAIFISPNGAVRTSSYFLTANHINILEMTTIVLALEELAMSHNLTHTSIKVLTDNMVSFYVVSKRYSPNFSLNCLALRLDALCSRFSWHLYVEYVSTNANPADVLSRGLSLEVMSPPAVRLLLSLVTPFGRVGGLGGGDPDPI